MFSKFIHKWGFLAIVIATSTPIPDDVILIPIAFAGYSMVEYFTAVFIGKTIISFVITFSGKSFLTFTESIGIPQYVQILALIAISLVFMFIITKVQWENVIKEYEAKGVQGALREIFRSLIK